MREVPDGADGVKRLADAALAASCATLSPNTADPCLVAVSYTHLDVYKRQAVFPSQGFTDHSLALNLLSLEKVDSNGEVTGKADILKNCLLYTSRCV